LVEGVEHRIMDVQGETLMSSIRASEAAVDHPPADVLAWLDDWDPARDARVLRPLFSVGNDVGGRRTWGRRMPSWQALEDKTVVDALWDAVGIARAPARNVPVEQSALSAAARELDRGQGTVWAGDNTSGWHGGASYTRWVETPDEARDALALFQGTCATARVMPFLEGIPCSIHGMVFDDHVIALRPCEMLVLRGQGTRKLAYAAASTFWDPDPADRLVMQETARRVGRHMRETLGYRGVFTIDGVMAAEGFLPTELNPRFGAAIGVMTRGISDLPMYLLHCALVEGEPIDWRPQELEQRILEAADAHRDGRTAMTASVAWAEQESVELVWQHRGFRRAESDEAADAKLMIGPAAVGTYVHISFISERTPVGPSLAPRAAAALNWANATYGLELGELNPAPTVR
jgi:hypothetical protein